MNTTLADEIDNALVNLTLLLDKAEIELERADLPPEWDDDLTVAIDAVQDAKSDIGGASDLDGHIDTVNSMLRAISSHDRRNI
ncbi:MAG: hypothetical protein Q7S17_10485 [Xanthobacteraceae bacterium]|nr:hypothetical protein [Xanthobacteraceae bacterium]